MIEIFLLIYNMKDLREINLVRKRLHDMQLSLAS